MSKILPRIGLVAAGTLVALGLARKAGSPILQDPIRQQAVSLLRTYVPSEQGDASFDEICKDFQGAGTTCGYLPSWLLYRLGCRAGRLVNRSEPSQGFRYRVGMNIAIIRWQPEFILYRGTSLPMPGDVFFISEGPPSSEHVGVLLAIGPDGVWECAEAGQRGTDGRQAARIVRRVLKDGRLSRVDGIGSPRPLVGWLDLEAAVNAYPDGVA